MLVKSQFPPGECTYAFVAEAPGKDEEERGVPLVGPSGQVFNDLLEGVGIERSSCFIGNVFSRRPPKNDVKWFFDKTKATFKMPRVGWLKPEFEPELRRIQDEIASVAPKITILLGNTAIWAFGGSGTVTAKRGAFFKSPRGVFLPTFHPAYVLRSWPMRATVACDLNKAKRFVSGELKLWPRREFWIDPTLEDLAAFEPFVLSAPAITYDIENTRRQITSIGFAVSPWKAINIPFIVDGKDYWPTLEAEQAAWRFVRRWLEAPMPKIAHYCTHDFTWLFRRYRIKVRNQAHDTLLMWHSLYCELPKKLGYVASLEINERAWKTMRTTAEDKEDA